MKILIVSKYSKKEWDSKNGLTTLEQLPDLLQKRIQESHDHQVAMREALKERLSSATFMFLDEFLANPMVVSKFDLVLSLGGDNSFTAIAQNLDDTLILGINTDPSRSVGSMCSWNLHLESDATTLVKAFIKEDFFIEKWNRLEPTIGNNIKCKAAVSELYIGERLRKNMSRYSLKVAEKDRIDEIKSSGLLIATKAGQDGWFWAASTGKNDHFLKEDEFTLISTEVYNTSKLTSFHSHLTKGPVEVRIMSRDSHLSVDSWAEYPLPIGTLVTVKLGKPLQVLKPRVY